MAYKFLKRMFDLLAAIFLIVILFVPMVILALLIKCTSRGPALHWSDRVGITNCIFKMPKFRTMVVETPAVATHLLKNPDRYITGIGAFMRKYSLDELPQLWSILKGDMSFVGPRPALFNQNDLVELRTRYDIHTLTPGVTGLAQINGRDELSIPEKVELDRQYLLKRSTMLDIKILWDTLTKVLKSEGVRH